MRLTILIDGVAQPPVNYTPGMTYKDALDQIGANLDMTQYRGSQNSQTVSSLNEPVSPNGAIAFAKNNVKGNGQRPYTLWAILPGRMVIDSQGMPVYNTDTGNVKQTEPVTFVNGVTVWANGHSSAVAQARKLAFEAEGFAQLTAEQLANVPFVIRDEWRDAQTVTP